jgi:hypothetical protein
MNSRQVIVLWIIAIALGGAVAIVKLGQKKSADSATDRSPGQTLFEDFPAEEIASITVAGAEETVTLAKGEKGWTIAERDAYPANVSLVNSMIRTLGDLKVSQSIEAGPSFAPQFGMDETAKSTEERGITATFKDAAGQEIAKVSLGKTSTVGGGGRYVRNHADATGFYKVGETFGSVTEDPKRWLAEGFLQIEKIKAIIVTMADSENAAWQLSRESEAGEFTLVGAMPGQETDATATGPLKTLFSFSRFDDVVPAAKVAETAQGTGKRIATIETFDGITYTVTFTPAKPAAPEPVVEGQEPPPPAEESFLLTVQITGEPIKERIKPEGETAEAATAADAAHAAGLKTLTERLAKEKALAGRTFQVSKWTVDALLKERDSFIKAPEQPTAGPDPAMQHGPATAVSPPIPAQPPTPNIPTRPPVTATTPPIEAVTPPVSVPPVEETPEEVPAEEAPPQE